MTFTEHENGEVVLQMRREDFDRLMILLGFGVSHVIQRNPARAGSLFRFVDRLNNGNPNYVPYSLTESEVCTEVCSEPSGDKS